MIKYLFPDLKQRSDEIELMDDPDSPEKELFNTLKQFKIINFLFTRSRYLINKYIINDILKDPKRSYTFLDLGAGGCDISFWLYKKCKKLKLNVKVTCLDSDARIIKYLKNKFEFINGIEIKEGCAFELDKIGEFDYIFSNHFLHHIPSKKIPFIINFIAKHTRRVFLLNDLYRSNFIFFGHSLFSRFFLYNSFAYYDGRISIKKGFLYKEMLNYIKLIKNKDFKIITKKLFPSRIYLAGEKK